MNYIVVGGVAAGASFACRLRRLDENSKITIFEKSNFVSYANCGLPYYISSIIKEKSSLTLQTPNSLKKRFNIDVFVNHEVVKINKEKKSIIVKDLLTNLEKEFFYDKLILALGAEAIKLTSNSSKIFELKTVEDSLRIKEYVINNNIHTATVIGGGFIGLEISENLIKLGIKVNLIEGRNHVLANLDLDVATFVHEELRNNNVNLFLNKIVRSIEEKEDCVVTKLDGFEIESDILIQAIGVRPNSKLAADSNLKLDFKNSIAVNDVYQTSDENIFAIGDVICLNSFFDNSKVNIALAGLANKEGRDLASYFAFNKVNEIKPLGTSILKLFNLSIGSVGLSEEQLKQKNIIFDKVYLSPYNHATYYPNSKMLFIKVLFNKNNYEILGAQIVGEEGVDKRIDVLATCIKAHLKGYELGSLELSYAPPFASAKDPINMIGYMIENLKNNLVKQFYVEELDKIISSENSLLIDVRTKEEYDADYINGSVNIPLDELRYNLFKINKDKTIYLICFSALRSYIAARILTQKGYDCFHLAGGYRLFKSLNNDLKSY